MVAAGTRLGKGFGETLTVMPELMYGMFTGKIRNFRMEDNLLPLGLLMAGLFVSKRSHPILKLLLLALGGMLLLGNAEKYTKALNFAEAASEFGKARIVPRAGAAFLDKDHECLIGTGALDKIAGEK